MDAATPADDSPRSGGYSSGRATKSAIVARAAEAFALDGFNGASMRSIARAADVDHSTLIHHFGSKAGLLLAVLEWQDARHFPGSISSPVTIETLPVGVTPELAADGFTAVAEQNRAVPGLVRLLTMLTAEAAAEDHPARPYLRERHRIIREVMASAVRTQRAAGVLDDNGLTPEQVAAVVISTWEGLQAYDALHPGEIDVPELLSHTLRSAFGLDH